MPKATAAKKPRKRKVKEAPPASRGLTAGRLASGAAPGYIQKLEAQIESDGGSVIGAYRDPLGGSWQTLAGLPIDKVEPTPFQRDVSAAHAARLAGAIDRLDRFLDPVIAVPADGRYWVPNGAHRLAAMRALGAKTVVAIVAPEQSLAYRILALNTEKAHNLRERALEVIRMVESLTALDDRPEREFQTEFEEPALITLGICYQQRGRFSGGAYHSILKRVEKFAAAKLSAALASRRERAAKLLELDDAVIAAVNALKARGFTSPYLKAFVVARINPLRFQRKTSADADETVEKMLRSAERFDAAKVKVGQVASAGGPPEE